MLEDDEVGGNLLSGEAGVTLVAVCRFSVKLTVQVIQRRLGYKHATAPHPQGQTYTLLSSLFGCIISTLYCTENQREQYS